MDFLDIFALIVMAILLAMVIWLVVLLGSMPGNIAKKRGHPQTEAIQVLGWIGIITLGISWFIAIVWAYTNPRSENPAELALDARIKAIESQLEQLQSGERVS
ncbi:MAG: DUF3302 domain-containing protein [Lysobacterales bacterium]